MVQKIDWLEILIVALCIIFATTISLYHISYDGYLKLSSSEWNIVWAISENSITVIMSFLLVIFTAGAMKVLFKWLFVPYFIVKLTYHISCFAQIYLWSKEKWEIIWSTICVVLILSSLIYFFFKVKEYKKQFKFQ